MPVVLPGSPNYAYVGRDDGTVQMIQLSNTGADPKGVIVIDQNVAGTDVYDPSLDFEGSAQRLVAVSGGVMRRAIRATARAAATAITTSRTRTPQNGAPTIRRGRAYR